MQARNIKVVQSQSTATPLNLESDAVTWGELKEVLSSRGVSLSSCEVVDAQSRVTYKTDSAMLPNHDMQLLVVPLQVKLGSNRAIKDRFADMTVAELQEEYEALTGKPTKNNSIYNLRIAVRKAEKAKEEVSTGANVFTVEDELSPVVASAILRITQSTTAIALATEVLKESIQALGNITDHSAKHFNEVLNEYPGAVQ
jgi:hypothetical protein